MAGGNKALIEDYAYFIEQLEAIHDNLHTYASPK